MRNPTRSARTAAPVAVPPSSGSPDLETPPLPAHARRGRRGRRGERRGVGFRGGRRDARPSPPLPMAAIARPTHVRDYYRTSKVS